MNRLRKKWKEKKAVIFDLDGTMIDSMGIWKQIDEVFMSERSLTIPADLQEKIEGMSFRETAEYFIKTFSLEDTPEELMAHWNQMAVEWYMTKIPFKPGLLEFLRQCRDAGISLGIATSNARPLVEAVLKAHGVLDFFLTIQTADEVERGKPAPDVYLAAAKSLLTDPKDCLVFEDVIMGILAGKNAEMEVCAVYDHHSIHQDQKKRELADYYITDYTEIIG